MPEAEPTPAPTGFLVRNEKAVLGVLVGALLVVGTIGALDDPFDDMPETDPFEFEEEFEFEDEFPDPPDFPESPESPEPPEFDFDEPVPEFDAPEFDFEEPPPIEVPAPDYQF